MDQYGLYGSMNISIVSHMFLFSTIRSGIFLIFEWDQEGSMMETLLVLGNQYKAMKYPNIFFNLVCYLSICVDTMCQSFGIYFIS